MRWPTVGGEKRLRDRGDLDSKTRTSAWSKWLITHWGRVTHICVGKLITLGSDNGLPPERRQAIIWTNAGILLIGPLGTNFSEILIEIKTFLLKKIRLKMSSAKCCSFRLGLNVITGRYPILMLLTVHGDMYLLVSHMQRQTFLHPAVRHNNVCVFSSNSTDEHTCVQPVKQPMLIWSSHGQSIMILQTTRQW